MRYDLNLYHANGEWATIESCHSLEKAKKKWAHFAAMREELANERCQMHYKVEAIYGVIEVDVSAYIFGDFEEEEEE